MTPASAIRPFVDGGKKGSYRRAVVTLALALATLLGGLAAPAHADDIVTARARESYGFKGWPGRDGPARDGIELAAVETPSLRRMSMDLRATPGGPVATIRFGASMVVRIFVEDSPSAAQEALLAYLAGCTRRLERLGGPRAPGDVAFRAAGDVGDLLAFAEANICAVIEGPGLFVDAIGDRITRLIGRSRLLDGTRGRSAATVTKVAPAVRPASPGGRHETPIDIDARGDIARRELAAEGGFVFEAPGGPVVRAARSGIVRVTVHALSTRGWRTSASASISVD